MATETLLARLGLLLMVSGGGAMALLILKYRNRFSPRRLAWVAAVVSLPLVPAHFFVSCEMSGRIMGCSAVLVLLTGFLTLADGSGKRPIPLVLAVVGLVVHSLCVH